MCDFIYHVLIPIILAMDAVADNMRPQPDRPPRSYCESETFKAKCLSNEVILMTSAKYGRMSIGQCVEADLGYLGCNKDVLDIADRKCSGKRECDVRIPDGDFDMTKPCYKELKVYLEASYRCVRVLKTDYGGCTTPIPVTQSQGHLLIDLDKADTSCRSWVFEGQPGQQINLTLVDFSWNNFTDRDQHGPVTQVCMEYGKVLDKSAKKNVSLCLGGSRREKHLMFSSNSSAEVYITQRTGRRYQQRRILIRYSAVGCPDLRRPKDAYLKRNQTDATVGCVATRQTWHLKCDGKTWVGVIGNCTQHLLTAQKEAQTSEFDTFIPHSLAIILIVGIAVIICLVIVSIGFACIRRYNQKLCSKRKGQVRYNNVRTDEDVYKTRKDDVITISQKTEHAMPGDAGRSPYHKKNDYSHIWEFPLPDPKQDRAPSEGPYRGMRSTGNTDSAYGTSLLSTRPGNDENYHVSMSSRTTDDSRYFVLDRDPCAPIPDDPEC